MPTEDTMMAALRFRELPAMVPGKLDVFTADPRQIVVMPDYNSRDMSSPDTLAHVDWIADEIEARGFIPEMPLTVRRQGDQIILVRGHCRLAACMKLIARGVEIVGVPVMQITAGMSDVDLVFDQQISNGGLPLDEFAKGRLCLKARRLGISDDEIARRMHWKNVTSVQQHIKMVELVPEPVKQQVAQGDISATEALKLVKSLPAGTDPVEAAKIIAANKEENKRLGIGKRNDHKVTPKTLQRDRPKAEPKSRADIDATRGQSLAEVQERIAEITGAPVQCQVSGKIIADGFVGTAALASQRQISAVEQILIGFVNADVQSLALEYARRCRELEETKADAGGTMQGQEELCLAADLIGALRFPEDWTGRAIVALKQVA
jgi:hypothetical protein